MWEKLAETEILFVFRRIVQFMAFSESQMRLIPLMPTKLQPETLAERLETGETASLVLSAHTSTPYAH